MFLNCVLTRISEIKVMKVLTFIKSSSYVITCQSLIFYMKPDNAGEGMWLQTKPANEKLKQVAQTQDIAGMQALPVLYLENLEVKSQPYYVS